MTHREESFYPEDLLNDIAPLPVHVQRDRIEKKISEILFQLQEVNTEIELARRESALDRDWFFRIRRARSVKSSQIQKLQRALGRLPKGKSSIDSQRTLYTGDYFMQVAKELLSEETYKQILRQANARKKADR